jgi:hypothetical protein
MDKEPYGGQMTFKYILKFYISRVETLQKTYSDKCTGIFQLNVTDSMLMI